MKSLNKRLDYISKHAINGKTESGRIILDRNNSSDTEWYEEK